MSPVMLRRDISCRFIIIIIISALQNRKVNSKQIECIVR